MERDLNLVLLSHYDLGISWKGVHETNLLMLNWRTGQFRLGKIVFGTRLIKIGIINSNSLFATRFLYQHHVYQPVSVANFLNETCWDSMSTSYLYLFSLYAQCSSSFAWHEGSLDWHSNSSRSLHGLCLACPWETRRIWSIFLKKAYKLGSDSSWRVEPIFVFWLGFHS